MNWLVCLVFGHDRIGDHPFCLRCRKDVRTWVEIEMDTQDRIERLEMKLLEDARAKRTVWKREPSVKNWSPRGESA